MAEATRMSSCAAEPTTALSSGVKNSIGIVLAAGQGKRMKTDLPKVAHTILGKPLIIWAAESLLEAGVRRVVLVISPQQTQVETLVRNWPFPSDTTVEIAYQDEAKGTGHAAACALPAIRKIIEKSAISPTEAEIIIGFGDTPAVAAESFSTYFEHHILSENSCTVLAFNTQNPAGYGRVVTGATGDFECIREDKDCSEKEKLIPLCNSGFLCVRLALLDAILPQLRTNNAAGEYYLTDVPKIARQQGHRVGVYSGIIREELEGVNSQKQLADLAKYLQNKIVNGWLDHGVQFLDPQAVYIEPGITFDPGVVVEPFVALAGKAHFSKETRLAAGTRLVDGQPT